LGDSRAVISRKGVAERISTDHKPLSQSERNRIRGLGGFVSENGRVNGVLSVSRSLGDFYLKPFVSSDPEISKIPFTSDLEFMILACDGVWDALSDQEAVSLVKKSLDDYSQRSRPTMIKVNATYSASIVRDYSFLYGSGDNISAIVIIFQTLEEKKDEKKEEKEEKKEEKKRGWSNSKNEYPIFDSKKGSST